MRRITVQVEDELHRRVRLKSVEDGTSITAVIVRALEDYVDGPKVKASLMDVAIPFETLREPIKEPTTPKEDKTWPEAKMPYGLSKQAQAKGRTRG